MQGSGRELRHCGAGKPGKRAQRFLRRVPKSASRAVLPFSRTPSREERLRFVDRSVWPTPEFCRTNSPGHGGAVCTTGIPLPSSADGSDQRRRNFISRHVERRRKMGRVERGGSVRPPVAPGEFWDRGRRGSRLRDASVDFEQGKYLARNRGRWRGLRGK